jgi:ABC-2 type transport system permease protein
MNKIIFLIFVLRNSFRSGFTYRLASLYTALQNLFFGSIRAAVLIALYSQIETDQMAGFTLIEVLTFTAFSQALISPISFWGNWELASAIQSGKIVSELTKPYQLYSFQMSRFLGKAVYEFIFSSLPVILGFILIFSIDLPTSAARIAACLLSFVLAVLLAFNWSFILNCICFWTIDAKGFGDITYYAAMLLSGLLLPVAFFPEWLQSIAYSSPFPWMLNVPAELFAGKIAANDWPRVFLYQASWVVALGVVARLLLGRGLRKLVVQGG